EASPDAKVTHFTCSTSAGQINFLQKQIGTREIRDNPWFKERYAMIADRPYLDLTSCSLNTTAGYNLSLRIEREHGFHLHATVNDNDPLLGFVLSDALSK